MRRRVASILAVVGLAMTGLIGFSTDPASAHLFDIRSAAACLTRAPSDYESGTLAHSHPVHLSPGRVDYACVGSSVFNCTLRWQVIVDVSGYYGPYGTTCT
jgi:hypothetical protein